MTNFEKMAAISNPTEYAKVRTELAASYLSGKSPLFPSFPLENGNVIVKNELAGYSLINNATGKKPVSLSIREVIDLIITDGNCF